MIKVSSGTDNKAGLQKVAQSLNDAKAALDTLTTGVGALNDNIGKKIEEGHQSVGHTENKPFS